MASTPFYKLSVNAPFAGIKKCIQNGIARACNAIDETYFSRYSSIPGREVVSTGTGIGGFQKMKVLSGNSAKNS